MGPQVFGSTARVFEALWGGFGVSTGPIVASQDRLVKRPAAWYKRCPVATAPTIIDLDEGSKANKSGSVLNPALLNIRTP